MKDNQKNSDMTFSELRSKEIINSVDGRRLGRAVDIVFDICAGTFKGIIAPYNKKTWSCKGQDVFIPLRCVQKVGEDVILVDLNCELKPPPKPPHHSPSPNCPPPNCKPPCPPPNCKPHCPPPNCSPPYSPSQLPDCLPCTPQPAPDCDGKCEKCMLIDCVYRWKR